MEQVYWSEAARAVVCARLARHVDGPVDWATVERWCERRWGDLRTVDELWPKRTPEATLYVDGRREVRFGLERGRVVAGGREWMPQVAVSESRTAPSRRCPLADVLAASTLECGPAWGRRFGRMIVDESGSQVVTDDRGAGSPVRQIDLGERQVASLWGLTEEPGCVITKAQLLERVDRITDIGAGAVAGWIGVLRRALGPEYGAWITRRRGFGYEFRPPGWQPHVDIVEREVEIDLRACRVWVRGSERPLQPREFELVRVFAAEPGRVFDRAEVYRLMWGHEHGRLEAVTVQVHRANARLGFKYIVWDAERKGYTVCRDDPSQWFSEDGAKG